jgi:vesicle transport protein SEC22
MCDRAYPKKLAFQYLEDLRNEFERVNGSQIETAARPYAFIKFGKYQFLYCHIPFSILCSFFFLMVFNLPFLFECLIDTFIQKTKKLYQDTHTQRNIAKLNDELYEVHQIMTRNVQEVLGVGEQLDRKLFFVFSE